MNLTGNFKKKIIKSGAMLGWRGERTKAKVDQGSNQSGYRFQLNNFLL
jgi:hypothetical protein